MLDPVLDTGFSADAPVATDDAFGTALISRLANEIFRGGTGGSAIPETPATVPAAPVAEPVSDSKGVDLSGGFPSSHAADAPPPVHPKVVGAEPERALPRDTTPQGGHVTGSRDTHEFGEPFSVPGNLAAKPAAYQVPSHPALPLAEAAAVGSRFYFLPDSAVEDWPGAEALESSVANAPAELDVERIRRDFPALHQRVNGHPLVWLDNAATTQKPQSVLDATSDFYGRHNSNIHRAAHALAERSTGLFEAGREKVRQFLGAADAKEIVFVRGTTEAINLVAQSYGRQNIGADDEIIVSQLEHHANIVPWQILAGQTGAKIRVIPINDRGELLLEEVPALFNARTKFVSLTQVSNALGTISPVAEIIALAHSHGVPVLVDGAQSTPHLPVNVHALGADFFVFSGHKVFGPTGIGALYGKAALLEAMPPWQGGGHMIRDVTFERTIYNNAPEKFEAGTPDIAGVVGLAAAIDYLFSIGIPGIAAYEHSLLEYATAALSEVRGIRPIGTARTKASVLGFVIPGIENSRIARHLDHHGIAVRAGHHCALPSLRHFGVESTVRPSLAFYNTRTEVDALVHELHRITRR